MIFMYFVKSTGSQHIKKGNEKAILSSSDEGKNLATRSKVEDLHYDLKKGGAARLRKTSYFVFSSTLSLAGKKIS